MGLNYVNAQFYGLNALRLMAGRAIKKEQPPLPFFTEKQLQDRLVLRQAYYKPLKKASRSSSEIDFRSLNACTAPLALVMMRVS